jgi:hypothetical protein
MNPPDDGPYDVEDDRPHRSQNSYPSPHNLWQAAASGRLLGRSRLVLRAESAVKSGTSAALPLWPEIETRTLRSRRHRVSNIQFFAWTLQVGRVAWIEVLRITAANAAWGIING